MRTSVSARLCRRVLGLELTWFWSREQFDPIDRDGLEAPASSQNKEGQYQCKKHGSTCASLVYILRRLPLSLTIAYLSSMQPMLRVEEADHQGESGR